MKDGVIYKDMTIREDLLSISEFEDSSDEEAKKEEERKKRE